MQITSPQADSSFLYIEQKQYERGEGNGKIKPEWRNVEKLKHIHSICIDSIKYMPYLIFWTVPVIDDGKPGNYRRSKPHIGAKPDHLLWSSLKYFGIEELFNEVQRCQGRYGRSSNIETRWLTSQSNSPATFHSLVLQPPANRHQCFLSLKYIDCGSLNSWFSEVVSPKLMKMMKTHSPPISLLSPPLAKHQTPIRVPHEGRD